MGGVRRPRQVVAAMKAPINNGDGDGAGGQNAAGVQGVDECFSGDRRYVRQRLKALKDSGKGRSFQEKQAVREALEGWRWI